jgi:hypothetical protein
VLELENKVSALKEQIASFENEKKKVLLKRLHLHIDANCNKLTVKKLRLLGHLVAAMTS